MPPFGLCVNIMNHTVEDVSKHQIKTSLSYVKASSKWLFWEFTNVLNCLLTGAGCDCNGIH